jgi:hypothetical protein
MNTDLFLQCVFSNAKLAATIHLLKVYEHGCAFPSVLTDAKLTATMQFLKWYEH